MKGLYKDCSKNSECKSLNCQTVCLYGVKRIGDLCDNDSNCSTGKCENMKCIL